MVVNLRSLSCSALIVLFLSVCVASVSADQIDVLTNRYGIERTGANLRETVLTAKNVAASQFGKLFEWDVDGDIYAQPLIKSGVSIPAVGRRNVVYVATVNNSLYAFDADSSRSGRPYWKVSPETFGDPVPKDDVTDMPKDSP